MEHRIEKRPSERKTLKIRAYLVENAIRVNDVARIAGLKHPTVSLAISGKNNSPRSLRALLEVGVPEELLALPDDFERPQVLAEADSEEN